MDRQEDGRKKVILPRSELKMLEKVFAAEVECRLPFESRSKYMKVLHEKGLIEPMKRTFGKDAFGYITAAGWQLTHPGRIHYCEWASKHAKEGDGK